MMIYGPYVQTPRERWRLGLDTETLDPRDPMTNDTAEQIRVYLHEATEALVKRLGGTIGGYE